MEGGLFVSTSDGHSINVHRHFVPCPTRPLALTIGNFDGVHVGHQAMLSKLKLYAAENGLQTAVMLFHPHPRFFFQPQLFRELWTLRDKIICLARMGIDHVYIVRFNDKFSKYSARLFIEEVLILALRIKYLLVGEDFLFGANRSGKVSLLREYGIRGYFYFETMQDFFYKDERISSTLLRQMISESKFDQVRSILGFSYQLFDRVRYGQRLGRKLGFPTINLRPPVNSVVRGTFIVQVHGLGSSSLPGVCNVGRRPTLPSGDKFDWLEVHLLDFSDDVYGCRVFVEFLKHLHEERHYSSIDELVRGISADCDAATCYFLGH
ncbi:riboflavin biosynthesis protein RibF [Candidatus Ichthyocystis sparus]|uniref:riboflavin biosynthesis protein RibF n=1 Tax=Candidatus Ichthyocystis sparus TaxID=1561004 RepID=UPI00159EF355|nr:riboflavin biosynthesis protein RibF [Candidatus Ichthyocystis sparus]